MPPVGYSRNLKRSCVTNRLQRKRDQLWRSQPLQQRLSALWPPCCEEAHSNTEDTTGRRVRCPGVPKCSPMQSDARCVKAVFMIGSTISFQDRNLPPNYNTYKHMRHLKKWFSCVHLAYRTMRNNCFEPLYFVSCNMATYLSTLISPLISCVPLCTSSYKWGSSIIALTIGIIKIILDHEWECT